ncbi:hypothetical protein SAMN05421847_0196 [Halpernia humi]|uniref:Phage abortive infection protein n=1 Tax=Halpernia humi TaxID=493375 RepID=A0A1H5SME7_9FLAO|nr:hypothetical protein [Halpernia humi]SEF51614.1 hypothetical protein SAMN05421847_0196 [Halpernia humi]
MIESKKEDNRLWEPFVIVILVIAGILLLFSLFSPYIFTRITKDVNYQFDANSGVIGDTFGIMNPFIGLIGILLTFLAFYMQIKANEEQIKQFNLTRDDDKKMLLQTQKIEAFDNLDLLSVNLDSIIKDLNHKGERIKEYENSLRNEPLNSHLLLHTSSKNYGTILDINRGAIYKAYRFFKVSNTEDYIKLYNILDFLPEFFDDFYPKISAYISDSFNTKMSIRNKIIEFLNQNAEFLIHLKSELGENYLLNENAFAANDAIRINYEIIKENYDEDGNPLSETDWMEIDSKLLKTFIERTSSINNQGNLDTRLLPIITMSSDIRKDIKLITQRAKEFSEQITLQCNDLFNDEIGELSVETTLIKINEKIKNSLEVAQIEIDLFYITN